MSFNKQVFFGTIKPLFGGRFEQAQVNGINAILDEWLAKWFDMTPPTQFAYVLATPWWETGKKMVPVEEHGNRAYFMHMYDKTGARPHVAAALGNTEAGDGDKFHGRGLPQVTGRANARKATERMRALGYIDSTVDFEVNPELLLDDKYAVPILFISMEEGWFTGRSLDKDIDPQVDGDEFADYLKSRDIINGKDHAREIANASSVFLKAIMAAMRAES